MKKLILVLAIFLALSLGAAQAGEQTLTSRPNIFHGQDWSNGISSKRNIFGGQDYQDRNGQPIATCKPNILGGQDCRTKTGR